MSDLKEMTIPGGMVCPDCKERVEAKWVRECDWGQWGVFWNCPACEIGSRPDAWKRVAEKLKNKPAGEPSPVLEVFVNERLAMPWK